MGQYYMPTLIAEDGSICTLYSHAYNNGLKLMEHSYIGNSFVNAVLTLLRDNPCRVAWIGDYSDSINGDLYESKLTHGDFMRYYEAAWGNGRNELVVHPKPQNILTLKSKRKYLVNHTQRVYIHMSEYIAANKWTEKGCWIACGKYDPLSTYDMCINPLPLLTACGNGRGCGDYHEGYPGYADVGSWAFEVIEITGKSPEGYTKVSFHFSERQEAA